MTDQQVILTKDQYYELIAFLITSAYLMYQGEQYAELYPSIRLMEVAGRLTKSLIENGSFDKDDWPHTFLMQFDESLSMLEQNKDVFTDFIQKAMIDLATREKSRNEQV